MWSFVTDCGALSRKREPYSIRLNRILSMQLDRGAGLLMLEAYRECTEWTREDEPLTLRSPGYSARVPTYGNV